MKDKHDGKTERPSITNAYADIQAIETFQMSLKDYASLHRWDKLALRYYLILKDHYQDEALRSPEEESIDDDLPWERMPIDGGQNTVDN